MSHFLLQIVWVATFIHGYPLEQNESFTLYFLPAEQVLRDASSPVLVATYDPDYFEGVKYITAETYRGAFEVNEQPLAKTLSQDILNVFGNKITNIKYTINSSEVNIQLLGNGTYTVEQTSGPKLKISNDEIVASLLQLAISENDKSSKTSAPEIVYPEILVIVHNDLFLSLDSNVNQTVTYVTEFFAKVDMRYRELRNPKVRLNIAGIVIAKSEQATPYIRKPIDNNMWESSLRETSKYMAKQRYLRDFYDVVVVLVKIPPIKEVDFTKHNTNGIANQGEPCGTALNEDGYFFKGVAIVGDNGRYSGVQSGAHELGHILGAPHDTSSETESIRCPRIPGTAYIMTYSVPEDAIIEEFSKCSEEKITNLLNTAKASCLYNKPVIKKPVEQTFQKYSLNETCEFEFGPGFSADFSGDAACTSIKCQKITITETSKKLIRTEIITRSSSHAQEGTICNPGHVCLKRKCVKEPNLP